MYGMSKCTHFKVVVMDCDCQVRSSSAQPQIVATQLNKRQSLVTVADERDCVFLTSNGTAASDTRSRLPSGADRGRQ